jgi:hypothetical protein
MVFFLQRTLRMKDFLEEWRYYVQNFVGGDSVAIKVTLANTSKRKKD